ncbi:MAG: sulfoxide reductase heme-binding subunit YedZ [Myxococcaceae bacterium]|nr:sulfoxide reductase heme-binding subunit YedZ [Myxococcaceae bacterium]
MIEPWRVGRIFRAQRGLYLRMGIITTVVLLILVFYTSVTGAPARPSLARLMHVFSLRDPALARAELSKALGLCAMALLALSLGAGPLARIVRPGWVLVLRRERKFVGVSAFAFALAHASSSLGLMMHDAVQLTRLVVGGLLLSLAALLILARMAQTSTKRARLRLGPEHWGRIHRLGALALSLSVLHFFALENHPVRGLHVRPYGWVVLATACASLLVRLVVRILPAHSRAPRGDRQSNVPSAEALKGR